jgi:hypothetical protein
MGDMRTSGKRYLHHQARHIAESRAIEMDAIVYDVSPSTRKCRVKIQGSDIAIVCDYNEGYQSPPVEVKPGQAVRIQRKGGIRGRPEVIGLGQTIPTGVAYPPIAVGEDAILTGLEVIALPDT